MAKIKAYDGTLIEERDVAVESARPETPIYNIPAMAEYAKQKRTTMVELPDAERSQFITGYHKQSRTA